MMEWQFGVDAKVKREALSKGFDSIVLMTPYAFAACEAKGRLPRSIELNALRPFAATRCCVA